MTSFIIKRGPASAGLRFSVTCGAPLAISQPDRHAIRRDDNRIPLVDRAARRWAVARRASYRLVPSWAVEGRCAFPAYHRRRPACSAPCNARYVANDAGTPAASGRRPRTKRGCKGDPLGALRPAGADGDLGPAPHLGKGDSLFNLVAIPRLGLADQDTAERLQGWHNAVGYLILSLAGLHAAAALVHRYAWRDGVLERMLPRFRGQRGAQHGPPV